MKQTWSGLALNVVGVMFILLLAACGDSPTMPTAEVSDYDIYFREISFEKIYAFNTAKMALVDSFTLPYEGVIPQVSADGRYLFLGHETTEVVDIRTRELVTELYTHSDYVVVSPDNRYIALMGDSLSIYDAISFSKVYSDTINPRYGYFSLDGRYFYCHNR